MVSIRFRLALFILIIPTLIAVGALGLRFYPTAAQQQIQGAEEQYFAESGHTVRGEFLDTYWAAPNPIEVYGYPITDAFQNPTTGRVVQYFQRAHFELHPENSPELRTQITLLGQILYDPGTSLQASPNPAACHYFSETGHQVCYSFFDFFEENGGIAIFGYPISEIEDYNGRLVQYFQRARFEWWPELPSGRKVVLSDLGRIYFDSRDEEITRLLPDEIGIPQSVLDLTVRSTFLKSVTPQESEQTIYVMVQDQNLSPVKGARVVITLHFPSGREATNVMAPTNENGITTLTFTFDDPSLGLVEATVEVEYDRFKINSRDSFRLWY